MEGTGRDRRRWGRLREEDSKDKQIKPHGKGGGEATRAPLQSRLSSPSLRPSLVLELRHPPPQRRLPVSFCKPTFSAALLSSHPPQSCTSFSPFPVSGFGEEILLFPLPPSPDYPNFTLLLLPLFPAAPSSKLVCISLRWIATYVFTAIANLLSLCPLPRPKLGMPLMAYLPVFTLVLLLFSCIHVCTLMPHPCMFCVFSAVSASYFVFHIAFSFLCL